jgi:hypothetical protein
MGREIAMMPTHPIEDATVRAFIIPARRDRYASLLGNPKKRREVLDRLNHCHDFDPRYATAVPSSADVAKLLRSCGAPPTCHVISDHKPIDGQEMQLDEAVLDGAWSGTLLCCIPGRLAYYMGEGGEQRILLRRDAS